MSGFLPIIKLSRAFGLSPFFIRNGRAVASKTWRPFLAFTIAYLSVQVVHTFVGIVYRDLYLSVKLPRIVAVVKFVTPLFLRLYAIIALIEAYTTRHKQVAIFNAINLVYDILTTKSDKLKASVASKMKFTIKRMIVISAVRLLLEVISLSLMAEAFYALLYSIPLIFGDVKYWLTITYIEAMRINIDLVRDQTLTLIQNEKTGIRDYQVVHANQVLSRLRKCHSLLFKMMNLLNHCVHWSLPIGIFFEFVMIVTCAFWVLIFVADARIFAWSSALSSLVWIVTASSNLVQLSHVCDRLSHSVS